MTREQFLKFERALNGLEEAESRQTDSEDRQPDGKLASFPEVLDGLQADEEKS